MILIKKKDLEEIVGNWDTSFLQYWCAKEGIEYDEEKVCVVLDFYDNTWLAFHGEPETQDIYNATDWEEFEPLPEEQVKRIKEIGEEI